MKLQMILDVKHKLITVEEASALCKCSRNTFKQRFLDTRKIPYVQLDEL